MSSEANIHVQECHRGYAFYGIIRLSVIPLHGSFSVAELNNIYL